MTYPYPAPQMTEDEISLLDKTISDCQNYLEFGIGGSTFLALSKNNIKRVITVETDPVWIDKMHSYDIIVSNQANGRLNIIHSDIGDIVGPGHPADPNNTKCLNYTINLWPAQPDDIDCCLIDGRFRLATALCALLFLPDCTFIWHDFAYRQKYAPVLPYIKVISVIDSMIVYKSGTPQKNMLSLLFNNLHESL